MFVRVGPARSANSYPNCRKWTGCWQSCISTSIIFSSSEKASSPRVKAGCPSAVTTWLSPMFEKAEEQLLHLIGQCRQLLTERRCCGRAPRAFLGLRGLRGRGTSFPWLLRGCWIRHYWFSFCVHRTQFYGRIRRFLIAGVLLRKTSVDVKAGERWHVKRLAQVGIAEVGRACAGRHTLASPPTGWGTAPRPSNCGLLKEDGKEECLNHCLDETLVPPLSKSTIHQCLAALAEAAGRSCEQFANMAKDRPSR